MAQEDVLYCERATRAMRETVRTGARKSAAPEKTETGRRELTPQRKDPLMTMRQASLDWVRRALSEELRDTSASICTRAENLVAIAEHYQIAAEELIRWIHEPCPKKQWSAAEWRRFCEQYVELRRGLGLQPSLPERES